MASTTLTGISRYPNGTSVSAYTASGEDKIGSPSGTAVSTATVSGNAVTFTGLTGGVEYVAYASVGGSDIYIDFIADEATDDAAVVPGNTYYADANAGSDSDNGLSWENAKLTIDGALNVMSEGDELVIRGKFREQLTPANTLGGITIRGYSNRPRHADSPWPSGAAWLAPVSPAAATPLLTIRAQGWKLENILFDGPSDAASVKLERNALSGDSEYDASHAMFVGCRFDTGNTGIEDAGGCFNVLVDDCIFRGITDGTGRAIYCSSTAVANPLHWDVRNSRFIDNDNHIVAAASKWFVIDNVFSAASVTTKISFSGGVAGNIVSKNVLGGTYSHAGGYTEAGAGDEWAGNFNSLSGGVTADDPA